MFISPNAKANTHALHQFTCILLPHYHSNSYKATVRMFYSSWLTLLRPIFAMCSRRLVHSSTNFAFNQNDSFLLTSMWEFGWTQTGNSLLIEAAKHKHRDVCEYLLSKGADASVKNNQGLTAADVCGDEAMRVRNVFWFLCMTTIHDNTLMSV